MPTFPFEANLEEISQDPGRYVDALFSCLESEFLVMPKGEGFIEYPVFERGYEALKVATSGFSQLDAEKILPVMLAKPISIVVLRSILGFTPPEWGYVATQRSGLPISQGFTRSLDRKVRMVPETALKASDTTNEKLKVLAQTACQLLIAGAPSIGNGQLHRFDKADTKQGVHGIHNLAGMGVPYAMLLYERFLGRPFSGHRDSVSGLIGDRLEQAIEEVLTRAEISFRKTKRAERIQGFDQAPDFIVPSEFNPQIVIEAKIAEDDGTARDKATRIQHLGELSLSGCSDGRPKYEVIACVGGRGFGIRREDMKKIIHATRGKVFTVNTLDRLVDCTQLKKFRCQ